MSLYWHKHALFVISWTPSLSPTLLSAWYVNIHAQYDIIKPALAHLAPLILYTNKKREGASSAETAKEMEILRREYGAMRQRVCILGPRKRIYALSLQLPSAHSFSLFIVVHRHAVLMAFLPFFDSSMKMSLVRIGFSSSSSWMSWPRGVQRRVRHYSLLSLWI